VGVSPSEPFREEKNVMLVPGIERLFRGQLACKLMTSPTALFHGMRIEFEDEGGKWNVGRNILCFFVHRMSHMHCLGIELESQQYGTQSRSLIYTVHLLSFGTGIIKSICVKEMTLLLFSFRHTSFPTVHTDLHGHKASGCLCRSRPLQWCLTL